MGPDGLSKVAPEKMRAGGLDAAVMAVAVGPKPRTAEGYAEAKQIAEAELAAVDRLIAAPDHQMVLARSAAQLLNAHADGRKALILGLQNALIFGEDIGAVDRYFERGVRVFALTHIRGITILLTHPGPSLMRLSARVNRRPSTVGCPIWEELRSAA